MSRGAGRRRGGAMDVFGGEIRRRDVFPLLVLHLIASEPAYGNRLIEEIEAITDGVISVNPNTIYPLLRDLEARGLIEGQWEHPDRRTRRFYSITAGGAQGVPAAGRRAGAVPRLGDRVGDPDQARDLRERPRRGGDGEHGLRVGRRRRLAGRGLGLLLRAAAVAGVGRRLRARGGVRRLSGGRRLAALALDPGGARRGHRARARARAAPPAPGRVPRPGERRRAADHFEIEGEGTRVTQELDYRLRAARPVRVADRPPVHPLAAARVARAASLARLKLEVGGGWPADEHVGSARPSGLLAIGFARLMFVFKAAVLGAGTMGGEIAQVIASADVPVVMKDVKQELIDAGLEKAREVTEGQLASLVGRRRSPRSRPTPGARRSSG